MVRHPDREIGKRPRDIAMRLLLTLIPLLLIFVAPASAEDAAALDTGERAAIRAVVEQQLAAFQRDDGSAAFSLASPAIQQQFRSPDNFMRMVRTGYLPVYRPREVQFGEITALDGDIVQRVELVGPDGQPAVALYIMQRQPDGSWRINGCFLTASAQRTT
jgi:ketosteroid isomerase-like protein